MLRPMFCRYGVGMKYGDHVDGAIMGDAAEQVRCDVAMTVCLSDAAEYEGGELVIDAAGVPTSWRGKAGDLIVYPADTLHRVNEVTSGTRDVAISWIQSMVRDGGAPAHPVRSQDRARRLRRLAHAARRGRGDSPQLLQPDPDVGVGASAPGRRQPHERQP